MTNPLLAVEWEPCALEGRGDKALEAHARRRLGMVPGGIRYLAHCPWLARAEVDLNHCARLLVHLDQSVADLASMVVSQVNSCRYCYAASRMLLRLQGRSEAEVSRIEERLRDGWDDARVEAALNFARRVGRGDPLPAAADRQRVLDAGFSEGEVRELAYVAAFTAFANRVSTLPAIPPYGLERVPDSRRVRWLRPLLALRLRRYVGPGDTSDPEPAAADVPYGYLAEPYAGTPIGTRLGRAMHDAWSSSLLTTRCKAMLFAVVATALGCSHSIAEARRLLRGEGMADADIDELLGHLRWDGLDAIESSLVPFARETVWYRPVQIQRRARRVREAMTAEQFLEGIGVLALANAACRLGAAIGVPA